MESTGAIETGPRSGQALRSSIFSKLVPIHVASEAEGSQVVIMRFIRSSALAHGSIFCTVLVFNVVCSTALSQSSFPADRVGRRGVRSWDDIPAPRSSRQNTTDTATGTPPQALSSAQYPLWHVPSHERRLLPETSALKSHLERLLETKDASVIRSAGAHLILPDPSRFFSETFGPDAGVVLCAEYAEVQQLLQKEFETLLKGLRGRKQTTARVVILRSASDPDANALQRAAMSAMIRPVSLYSVQFFNPKTRNAYNMYSFAYVDGSFRFIGRMQALPSRKPVRGDGLF